MLRGRTADDDAAAPPVAPPPPSASALLDEIRFYISQGMWNEAHAACARCQAITPGNPELIGMQSQVTAALAPVKSTPILLEPNPA